MHFQCYIKGIGAGSKVLRSNLSITAIPEKKVLICTYFRTCVQLKFKHIEIYRTVSTGGGRCARILFYFCKKKKKILKKKLYPRTKNSPKCHKYVPSCLWDGAYKRTLAANQNGRQERRMFYLTTHSTHFIYVYMASDIW